MADSTRRSYRVPPLAAACFVAAAALAACASSVGAHGAGGDPAADIEERFYEARCGGCHVPFHRTDFAPRKWSSILAVMGPRAGLSPAQRERILAYLTSR
ncbi:MAG: hypothetical protein K8T90_14060 [Planctomycetes bacterium]|nr:hypothetical protein [Planctomycetota bacterium]